jgi:hypothetical protein
MRFAVSVQGRAEVTDLEPGADETALLEQHFEEVMEQLVGLEEGDERITDSDLSARLATGEVEISVVVEAENTDEAGTIGNSAIRCAVHAAGGHTPGWEEISTATWELEVEESTQKKLDLVDA